MTSIGILGFGEAGSVFAAALADAGADVAAYDRRWDSGTVDDGARRRADAGEIRICNLTGLLQSVQVILSTVTTDAALDAARQCLPRLRPEQLYCDLNSTAPSIKRELDDLITAGGAVFVEGAILGAIGVSGASTQIYLGGAAAAALSRNLNSLGLNTRAYSREIGKASTFKMLRSIFSKGLEALIIEFLTAGERAGLRRDLWQEVTALMAGDRFERVAQNWVRTHALAHERRCHEMQQVNELLAEMGFDAIMSEATGRFFERSVKLRLGDDFDARPENVDAVVRALSRRMSAGDA
jgi:3-hydroxyisobutyrate dehydrogenase-like beta-hydroxyacid dehydrogenase